MHASLNTIALVSLTLLIACGDEPAANGGQSGSGGVGSGQAGAAGAAGQAGSAGISGSAGDQAGAGAGASGAGGTGAGVSGGGTVASPEYPSKVLSQRSGGCVVRNDDTLACWDSQTLPLAAGVSVGVGAVDALYMGIDDVAQGASRCVHRPSGGYTCEAGNDRGGIAPASGEYLQLALSNDKACGLRPDGKLACWINTLSLPMSGFPTGDFIQIDTTGVSFCGLHPDGSGECWDDEANALAFPAGESFVQISTGHTLRCGITMDARIVCWAASSVPPLQVPVPSGKAKQVSVGVNHGCAIMQDDTVQCFGHQTINYAAPDATLRVKALSSGQFDDCAIALDDRVWCWGGSGTAGEPHALMNSDGSPLIAKHF